jgi:putative peptide zinc metalloprotease protein
MNGERTLQELWDELCASGLSDLPSQNEIVELLMQLHSADLLYCDVTPDSAALFKRYRQQRWTRWKQRFANPLSIRFPLFNPDTLLALGSPYVRRIFTAGGFICWLALVLPALFLAGQHWRELTENVGDRVLSAQNLLLMGLLFIPIKALHELGHGFATKLWGGTVPEIGVMLLVFAPVPYVDSSAAATFPSKYQRAVVGAAGMLVELALAACALYVWLLVEPGLVRALAFNVMVIAGFSTVVVNGNPLLRYDGYFILSDLIEIPNLAQRGAKYWTYLSDRYLFRARDLEAPAESPAERAWLLPYTVLSWIYRTFVTVTIILFVATKFFVFGVALALWGTFTLVVMPIWKAIRHIGWGSTLRRQRRFAVRTSIALTTILALFLGFVPASMHSTAEGVVWLPEQFLIRAKVDGFFDQWLVESGVNVNKGMPLLLMSDKKLEAQLVAATAEVAEYQARYDAEAFTDPVQAAITQGQLIQSKRRQSYLKSQHARLAVAADANGLLVIPQRQDMESRFYRQGELLGYVLDRSQLIARVAVTQDNVDLVRSHLQSIELRTSENIAYVADSYVIHSFPEAVTELPSPAFTSAGGGSLAADPQDQNGQKVLHSVFLLDLTLSSESMADSVGGHVYVRFNHVREPVLKQLYRRVRQLLLSHLNV